MITGRYQSSINKGETEGLGFEIDFLGNKKKLVKVKSRFLSNVSFGSLRRRIVASLAHWDSPKSFSPLKAVASPTSSGFLFMKAAIISTIAGRLQGSFRWKVQ